MVLNHLSSFKSETEEGNVIIMILIPHLPNLSSYDNSMAHQRRKVPISIVAVNRIDHID